MSETPHSKAGWDSADVQVVMVQGTAEAIMGWWGKTGSWGRGQRQEEKGKRIHTHRYRRLHPPGGRLREGLGR